MADPLERATNLLALLLEARVPQTFEQITDALRSQYPEGVSALRGAFERDKALLREVGVPIEQEVLSGSEAGQTGYRIDRGRYELTDLELAEDERQALQLAVAAVRSSDAQFGLLKLGGVAGGTSAVSAELPHLAQLPSLRDAIARRCEVQFGYHGGQRSLWPFGLLLREGFWYVIGHDVDREALRTFRVDRIAGDVTVGDEQSFTRPADFDPRQVFPDPKEIGDASASKAIVRVGAARVAAVLRELGDGAIHERHANGEVSFVVACANLPAFRSWVLGLGEHAEVIDPPEARAAIVEWLRDLAVAR
jgi:predicted DNA-binding transcriptional regulator YafY